MKKVLITGGSGFVGRYLTDMLVKQGHQVTALGGHAHKGLDDRQGFRYLVADTSRPGDWQQQVAEQQVLINLAGRSVFHLWNEGYKKSLYDSRILTTRHLVEAMAEGSKDTVLLSTSAAGYYGNGGELEQPEESQPGNDFLAKVCVDWEAEALKATAKGARVALARFGVVLGQGGALATMRLPFSLGLGGPLGSGRQWFPWMHLHDLCRALCYLMENDTCQGAYNFVAPEQVRQKEFAQALGRALHRPAFLPAPALVMKMVLGEFGASLLQGQRLVPLHLQEDGFTFDFPGLEAALDDLV